MRFSRDVTNARIVSRTARRIALRSAQAIEDRANGETNAAWVDEDRAVNRRDAQQQQRGRERGSRGARLRYSKTIYRAICPN
jgi:hypothetical protein